MTEDGLYVACDAYVAAFQASESGNWWDSPNLEYFVGPFTGDQNQRWVSCTNKEGGFRKEGNVTEAFVKYEAVQGSVTNHVIIESFIAKGQLDPNWFYSDGSIRVGMAFDTNNAQGGGYVVPTGTHERNNRTHVTAKGVYAMGDFFADDGESFVEQGAQWSYLTATRDPNAAAEGWNTALNAQWNTAKAPFGNRAPGATNAWGTNDNPSDGTQTNAYLWVAREFTVEDLSDLEGMDLYVNMFYDDTIVLYVNGTAVYTHNTGEPWNGGYTLYRLSEDISSLLVEGTNVIAASLHQHHGGYEFDLSLFASDSAVLDDLVK